MASSYRYDPALDAQAQAVQRGLVYAGQQASTAQSRALQDYGIGVAGAQQQYGQAGTQLDWQGEDAKRAYERQLQDIAQGKQRTTEDYNTSTADINRSYQRLAASQQGKTRAAGVLTGGALLAAARNRGVNRGLEQSALDTNYNRQIQDFGTAGSRAGEDYNTLTSRLTTQRGWLNAGLSDQLGSLGLNLTRAQNDISSQLAQQQQEAAQFGLDTEQERRYLQQLASGGY